MSVSGAVPIHPYDVHEILNAEDGPIDVVYDRDFLSFWGQQYRQTTRVPALTKGGRARIRAEIRKAAHAHVTQQK